MLKCYHVSVLYITNNWFYIGVLMGILVSLIPYICVNIINRIGGSGMDLRSKAKVINFSFKNNLFMCMQWRLICTNEFQDRWNTLFWFLTDSFRTGHRSLKASKVELWWIEHRPGAWRRQWSDPIVGFFFDSLLHNLDINF